MTRTTTTLDRGAPATLADVETARQLAQLERDNEEARRQAQRQRQRDKLVRRRRRQMARRQLADKVVTIGPLLVVNTVAVGGQVAYGYGMPPADWHPLARLAVAVAYAVAVESVALYVAWHAHDALMLKAYGTARRLRRASYAIAALVAALNYSHFAHPWDKPNAFAVGCGLLSLLSPWLWGLHSRRASNVRLLAEGLADEAGAEFSSKRRRHFPLRTLMATRWSIENNEREPRLAWDGYNADPDARLSRARRQAKRDKSAARHRAGGAVVVVGGDKPASDKPTRDSRPSDSRPSDSDAGDSSTRPRRTRRQRRTDDLTRQADVKARGVQLAREGKTAEEIAAALSCHLRSAQRYVKAAKADQAAA